MLHFLFQVNDWIAYLETMNVKVLRNQHVKIRPTTAGQSDDKDKDKASESYLCLAGANDILGAKVG